jgi:hypothetical protein
MNLPSLLFFGFAAIAAFSITAEAQELGIREWVPSRGFSLQVPEGFTVQKKPEIGSIEATHLSDSATITAQETESEGDLSELAKVMIDAMEKQLLDYKLFEQKTFTMKSGIGGIKLYLQMRPSEDAPISRRVIYLFDCRPGHAGIIACGSVAKDDFKFDSLWEKVVNSVVVQ